MTLKALAQRIERLAPPRDIIAIRDAHDRAERITTSAEAERILERALRTNDTSLAYAVLHQAAERSWVELPERTATMLTANMQLTDGALVETTADRIRRIAGENAIARPSTRDLRRAAMQIARERRMRNPEERPDYTGLTNRGRELYKSRHAPLHQEEEPEAETAPSSLLPGRTRDWGDDD
ncbi:hypothetical protein [Microbacterium sp. SORGH_AS_0888]|uniref:hypothetical protein n=1 Tax=Microbacterium sp. SORGH_AS_0888 TaxID=3041791 RepID=UPI00278B3A67|nr:hypothetical protein [Microbacterium sp. SORGH_AS_0888]MDQ1130244.1 DNA-binding phage protein [Microbacterium sp. SORGH_AS_0888]